jgi:glycine cleavage system H protein
MRVPSQLLYTAEHEWLDLDGDVATVGVTEYAAAALGDIVFVELPAEGVTLVRGTVCGELESTKSVSDIYSPADGTVLEVNAALADNPELVNLDPFGEGWMFRMRVGVRPDLLEPDAYAELTADGG